MADNWGGEYGGPSDAELRAQGYEWIGGDGGYWQAPAGWERDPSAPMGYSAPKPENQPWFYKPKTSEEELRRLTTTSPYTVGKWTEGGEGGRMEYTTYDPASTAKFLLNQPAQVSADYIRNNFPSLAQLPQSVLAQMGQDWRTAYAHLQKLTEPSTSGWSGGREGIVPIPIRIEGNQPFLSTGGNGELFTEALPYVTYSPEYGLAVPKAGLRPYREKFGIMNLVPSLMLGSMVGPLAGALGGGILGTAAAGALTGAAGSALQGGDALKGALTGGITGGLGAAASPVVNQAVGAAGLTGAAADAVAAGTMAAGRAALTGGDPLQSALMAAASAGVGNAVGGLDLVRALDPDVAKAVTGAASGATRAAVTGGDPIQAALKGAASFGAGQLFKDLPISESAFPVPVAELDYVPLAETPTESWIDQGMLGQPTDWDTYDLLETLRQQEEDQAGMKSEILGYDPRILEALGGADMEQEDLQRLLSQTGSGGASFNLGKALSGIGSSVGKALAPGQTAGTAQATQTAQQPMGQGQTDFGSLLAMMGMMQNKEAEKEAPVPLVGEIKPYQFSTDLLQGVYNPGMARDGSADELMKIIRG